MRRWFKLMLVGLAVVGSHPIFEWGWEGFGRQEGFTPIAVIK
jgi:hypothetical protein